MKMKETLAACPPLSGGLGIPTREQLIWALCEVLDGTWTWYDLQADTGLSQGECEKLLEIRNAVKQQWTDSGMKMPNEKLTSGAHTAPETE